MIFVLAALLMGIVAGLRAMTAPAVLSWAAQLGFLPLAGTPLAFLGFRFTPWIISLLAVGGADYRSAALDPQPQGAGAVRYPRAGGWFLWCRDRTLRRHAVGWMVVGAIGAVLGSFGGAAARGTLTRRLGSDRPAALLEDVVAIVGATLAVAMLP